MMTNELIIYNDDKFDYLADLREKFDKLENEVWNYHTLRTSESYKIDLELPLFLIESFTKLFNLWKNFSTFQNLIDTELFRKIYYDMNDYFGMDINELEIYCDICHKNISLQANNLKLSYELHSEDDFHQQVLGDLSLIAASSPVMSDANSSQSDENEFDIHIISMDNRLKCNLCDKFLIDKKEAIHHISNWPHRLRKIELISNDTNCIVEIDGTYCCRLCCCKLSNNTQYQMDHISTVKHLLLDKCFKALAENKSIALLNRDRGEFVCRSCDQNGFDWNELLEHCESSAHIKTSSISTFSNTETQRSSSLSNSDRYDDLECNGKSWSVEEYKDKSNCEPKEEFEEICSDVSSSNQYKSEFCNEMLATNDVFIEKKFGDNFKCKLCNESGEGSDNLLTHCASDSHQELAKYIETVSRIYMNMDRNIIDEIIIDRDEIYHCLVCDVVIEDEEYLAEHVREKQHILLEKLQMILNENGACILLIEEHPVRIYYCRLCHKKMIEHDMVIHAGNSKRHEQLLKIVKQLSRDLLF